MKKMFAIAATTAFAATASNAYAQSSVTLYGAVDDGLNYTSNAGGHHAFSMVSGDTQEAGFGLKGIEDLGGGLSAIFTLENGVNMNSGALNEGGRLFGKQAFVGLASDNVGTLTLGRQYDASLDVWSPFTAAGSTQGDLAAHPFDNDNADADYRNNNAVKYVSPKIAGLQGEVAYAFSNDTNFANNRAYSLGLGYSIGQLSAALAYVHQTSGGATTGGAVGSDAVFVAASQQNLGAALKWAFSDGTSVGFAYSHVVANSPIANGYVTDIGTLNWTRWKFDNFEINGQYFLTTALSLAGSYTYTHGDFDATTASYAPNWHQVALTLNYALSKRTSVYLQGAWQHTNGKTGTGLDDAHIVGAAGASSSGNQSVVRIALSQKF